MITNLTFVDQDLDALELGGPISWIEPENVNLVAKYLVYLAEDLTYGGSSYVGVDMTGGRL